MKRKTTLSTLPASARCAIYCRFSDQDADAKGAFSSNDAQRLACIRFIEQAGASIVRVYSDESKTGTNLKRPGWRELLQDAQEGQFTHVVVTSPTGLPAVNSSPSLATCSLRAACTSPAPSSSLGMAWPV